MEEGKAPDASKKPRHRSPNYPTVGLRDAVERVTKLYRADGKAGAPPDIAAVHIGFNSPHGTAMSTIAALKRFGLVSEANGRIVPTQRAIEIINLPSGDPRRERALRDAALDPPIYRELVEQHRVTGWPKPDVLERELETYKNFNPRAVKGFVEDMFDSLEFAGLTNLSELNCGNEANECSRSPSEFGVGDYVQWESQGALQFPTPKRIREFSEDFKWAFVEGSNTGVPINQLAKAEPPEDSRVYTPPMPRTVVDESQQATSVGNPKPPLNLSRQDVFSLQEGPVTIQWPASISVESFEDLSAWLDILKRKIGRSVKVADSGTVTQEN